MDYLLDSAVVLDTETTGMEPAVDRLVELAALSVQTDNLFHSLCNPGRGIPPEVMAIHHITEQMTNGQDSPERVAERMFSVLPEPKLAIAHNAKFDLPFVKHVAPSWDPIWICTYKCSVMTWPDAPKHSNQVLRYWLGLKCPLLEQFPDLAPHRALYDIIVTREIFRTLLQFNTLEQLILWSSGPLLLPKVPFGKHKDKLWSEVDYGYLKWCLTQSDMNEDVLYTARAEISRRYPR
jgi:exodeoxyribonuclease X